MTSLNLYEKKGNYYAECYDPDRRPKRKYRTLRTRDKRVARQKLVKLEHMLARGDWDPWDERVRENGVLFSEGVERYIKARSHLRPKTLRADRSTLNLLKETLPPGTLLEPIPFK